MVTYSSSLILDDVSWTLAIWISKLWINYNITFAWNCEPQIDISPRRLSISPMKFYLNITNWIIIISISARKTSQVGIPVNMWISLGQPLGWAKQSHLTILSGSSTNNEDNLKVKMSCRSYFNASKWYQTLPKNTKNKKFVFWT